MEGWRWEVCEGGEEASGTVRTAAGPAVAMSKGWRSEGGREEGEVGMEERKEEGKEGRKKRKEGVKEEREEGRERQ